MLITVCEYKRFSGVAKDEGNPLVGIDSVRTPNYALTNCQDECYFNINKGCQSFGYCSWISGGTCYLFDKRFTLPSQREIGTRCLHYGDNCHPDTRCFTSYWNCEDGNFVHINSFEITNRVILITNQSTLKYLNIFFKFAELVINITIMSPILLMLMHQQTTHSNV